jgi:carbon monoxide dehydrogenase subunit G
MAIELDNSFTVPVPPAQAWHLLLDVERIAPCLPGASVLSVDGDSFEGQIRVKLGPLSLTYQGTAKFVEKDRVTGTITLDASGRETRGSGTASASVNAVLKPGEEPGTTTATIHTSLNVTGKPAQFGRSLLPEVSGKLIAQFADNLAALIASDPVIAELESRPVVLDPSLSGHWVDLQETRGDAVGRIPDAVPRFSSPPLVIGPAPRLTSSLVGLPGGPYKVPDTVLDGADLDGIEVRGASLRGDEHRHYGATRQDAMDICRVRDDTLEAVLGCVADGVGSQPLSQLGAAQACVLVREEVRARLPALFASGPEGALPSLCQDLAERVAERLAQRAGFLKVPPQALSTTLAAAVVEAGAAQAGTPHSRRWVAFAVGDAMAFVLRGGVFYPCFAHPGDAAPASTPPALPVSIGRVAAAAGEFRPGDALVVCTGGLSMPIRNPLVREQLAAWWGSGRVPTLPEFGWQMSFRIMFYRDDRTAVCFWPK